jgi:hypothetical protein
MVKLSDWLKERNLTTTCTLSEELVHAYEVKLIIGDKVESNTRTN